jgi:hypothetical protein
MRNQAAFRSTGTLACAGFDAFIIDAQPRVAVLRAFFRSLFSRWPDGNVAAPQSIWIFRMTSKNPHPV